MSLDSQRPLWRLPRGVTRALWDHAQIDHRSARYDEQFSREATEELDEQVVRDACPAGGRLFDLGCGVGRLTLPLARSGYRCLAIDLSRPALQSIEEQARREALSVDLLCANLVELDCLSDASADCCISMFSTLGMIRGRENRHQMLTHVRRVLKPGGRFVVHVHNRWYSLFQPQSRGWFLKNLWQHWTARGVELGDKYFDYQGVPNMFLHVFTRSEFQHELRNAGFVVERLLPLTVERRGTIAWPWLCGGIRAGGWIAVCR